MTQCPGQSSSRCMNQIASRDDDYLVASKNPDFFLENRRSVSNRGGKGRKSNAGNQISHEIIKTDYKNTKANVGPRDGMR